MRSNISVSASKNEDQLRSGGINWEWHVFERETCNLSLRTLFVNEIV